MQNNKNAILKENEISFRDEKYARIKIAILNETLEQLKHTNFDDIMIVDLCKKIGISKRTFFNYFPLKSHIILYLLQIWIIEITTSVYHIHGFSAGLELVYAGFEQFAQKIIQHPSIILEIVKNVFNNDVEKTYIKAITPAEEKLLSLDTSCLVDVPTLGFRDILKTAVKNEIASGNLSPSIDLKSIEISMNSILLGVPLCLDKNEISSITAIYKQQLTIFWNGYRVTGNLSISNNIQNEGSQR